MSNGNLVARTDRFGNRTQFTWEAAGEGRWRPTSIVDGYGLTTTFTYGADSSVEVSAPARSDGVGGDDDDHVGRRASGARR